eukprot:8320218-Pyramimonas_sp.AAC.1
MKISGQWRERRGHIPDVGANRARGEGIYLDVDGGGLLEEPSALVHLCRVRELVEPLQDGAALAVQSDVVALQAEVAPATVVARVQRAPRYAPLAQLRRRISRGGLALTLALALALKGSEFASLGRRIDTAERRSCVVADIWSRP